MVPQVLSERVPVSPLLSFIAAWRSRTLILLLLLLLLDIDDVVAAIHDSNAQPIHHES
jgi:hypothetical protein